MRGALRCRQIWIQSICAQIGVGRDRIMPLSEITFWSNPPKKLSFKLWFLRAWNDFSQNSCQKCQNFFQKFVNDMPFSETYFQIKTRLSSFLDKSLSNNIVFIIGFCCKVLATRGKNHLDVVVLLFTYILLHNFRN